MERRARPLPGLAIVTLAAALALGACAASAGPGWTYVPPAQTPQSSATASGAPGASSGASSAPATSGAASSAAPAASSSASSSGAPAASGAAGGGAANEIDLVETASLQITNPAGQPVTSITVTKGQTYHFKVTNTAGFVHNLYVGKVSDLEAGAISSLTGTGDFTSGTKEFDYTFTDTSVPLGFGCMVPGHYQAGMKGTFTVQ